MWMPGRLWTKTSARSMPRSASRSYGARVRSALARRERAVHGVEGHEGAEGGGEGDRHRGARRPGPGDRRRDQLDQTLQAARGEDDERHRELRVVDGTHRMDGAGRDRAVEEEDIDDAGEQPAAAGIPPEEEDEEERRGPAEEPEVHPGQGKHELVNRGERGRCVQSDADEAHVVHAAEGLVAADERGARQRVLVGEEEPERAGADEAEDGHAGHRAPGASPPEVRAEPDQPGHGEDRRREGARQGRPAQRDAGHDPPADGVRRLAETEDSIDECHQQEGGGRVGEQGGGGEEEVRGDEEQRQGQQGGAEAEDTARDAEREGDGERRRNRRHPGHGVQALADREGGGMPGEVDPVHLPVVHDELVVEEGPEGRRQGGHVDPAGGKELAHEGIGMLVVADDGVLEEAVPDER